MLETLEGSIEQLRQEAGAKCFVAIHELCRLGEIPDFLGPEVAMRDQEISMLVLDLSCKSSTYLRDAAVKSSTLRLDP